MTDLSDKAILITGASSGIGEATARVLASHNAAVMLAARRADRLASLKKEIEASGGRAEICVTDVTDQGQFQQAADRTIDRFGKIDVLFNNAGIMPLSYMNKLKVAEWHRMVEVNIKGVLNGIAAVLSHFLNRQEGHLINVSSVAGHVVFPGSAVYSATKFAVRAITEGLRMELHPATQIRVSLISPGAVSTELADAITDPDVLENWKKIPVIPMAPERIADAVVYAVSQPPEVDVSEIIVRPVSQNL